MQRASGREVGAQPKQWWPLNTETHTEVDDAPFDRNPKNNRSDSCDSNKPLPVAEFADPRVRMLLPIGTCVLVALSLDDTDMLESLLGRASVSEQQNEGSNSLGGMSVPQLPMYHWSCWLAIGFQISNLPYQLSSQRKESAR